MGVGLWICGARFFVSGLGISSAWEPQAKATSWAGDKKLDAAETTTALCSQKLQTFQILSSACLYITESCISASEVSGQLNNVGGTDSIRLASGLRLACRKVKFLLLLHIVRTWWNSETLQPQVAAHGLPIIGLSRQNTGVGGPSLQYLEVKVK